MPFRRHGSIKNQEAINNAILANPDLQFKEISEMLGETPDHVRNQARKMGVKRYFPLAPIDDGVLINEYCTELRGYREIAQTHHYGERRTRKRLVELGLLRSADDKYSARTERKSRRTGRPYPFCMDYPLVRIPEGHTTRSKGMRSSFAFKHIITMEQHLRRPLTKAEKVHHIDFDKQNCAIENLLLCESNSAHAIIHRSLDEVARELYKKGIIRFNGRRYVTDKVALQEYLAERDQEESFIPDPTKL
jgi:hypothetical protein